MKTLYDELLYYFQDEIKDNEKPIFTSNDLLDGVKEDVNEILLKHINVEEVEWVDTPSFMVGEGDNEETLLVKYFKITDGGVDIEGEKMFIHSILFTPPMFHRDMENDDLRDGIEGKLVPAITDPETFKLYSYIELKWETGLTKEEIIEQVEYLLSDEYSFEGERGVLIRIVTK